MSMQVSTSHMELKVWIGSVQRIVAGVTLATTSYDIIVALAQATGKTGRFTLVEKWRDYEKTLAPSDCPLELIQTFGDYAHEVQFVLRHLEEEPSNRRLQEAKSPKPQRRTRAIKKSLSFSGGPQSNHSSRSPKFLDQPSTIPEEQASACNTSDSASGSPSEFLLYDAPQPVQSSFRPIKDLIPPRARKQHEQLPEEKRKPSAGRTVGSEPLPEERYQYSQKTSWQQKTPRTASPLSSSYGFSISDKPQRDSPSLQNQKSSSMYMLEEKTNSEYESISREAFELQQSLVSYEKRLQDENRKLQKLDKDIASVTSEEETKWGQLYDYRDEMTKAIAMMKKLDIELEELDEVLISEELNVLFRKKDEMLNEIHELEKLIADLDSDQVEKTAISLGLKTQLENIMKENMLIEKSISGYEEEAGSLQLRVDEKKRFLIEAENGYSSVCDEYKEVEDSLEKRKQMLVELERELREYNLKSFINTGFSDKATTGRLFPQDRRMLDLDITKGLYV